MEVLFKKIEKFLDVWTRVGEMKLGHQDLPAAPAPTPAPAPKKEKTKKAEKAEAETQADPLAPQAPAEKEKEKPKGDKEPTEAESKAELDAAAQAYVNKFSKMDEGLAAARKIMAEEFKVTRLSDLAHKDRILIAKRFREEAAKVL